MKNKIITIITLLLVCVLAAPLSAGAGKECKLIRQAIKEKEAAAQKLKKAERAVERANRLLKKISKENGGKDCPELREAAGDLKHKISDAQTAAALLKEKCIQLEKLRAAHMPIKDWKVLKTLKCCPICQKTLREVTVESETLLVVEQMVESEIKKLLRGFRKSATYKPFHITLKYREITLICKSKVICKGGKWERSDCRVEIIKGKLLKTKTFRTRGASAMWREIQNIRNNAALFQKMHSKAGAALKIKAFEKKCKLGCK